MAKEMKLSLVGNALNLLVEAIDLMDEQPPIGYQASRPSPTLSNRKRRRGGRWVCPGESRRLKALHR
jgi:hypothetical protein